MSKRHHTDYDEIKTARCERALVTLLGDIGPWNQRVYLAGGLAPRYIVGTLPEGARPHVGTTDIDLVIGLSVDSESAEAYRTLENNLKKAGFETPEDYRRWLTEQQRRTALHDALMQSLRDQEKLKPVSPTEQQMRDFYDARRAALGKRPATISFRQVVVAPRPDSAAKAQALALADSIVVALRDGADFATAARRFSKSAMLPAVANTALPCGTR